MYLVAIYLVPWLHRRRTAEVELPESWEKVLMERPSFAQLSENKKERVRSLVKVFMAEKYFEPDDLLWHKQVEISAIMALKVFDSKHKFLPKLSTIRISEVQNFGQGLLEVTSIESLNEVDLEKWF